MKRILSVYSLIPVLIAAGAASLHAQNVVVEPTSLSFSAQFGVVPVSQPLKVTSSTSTNMFFQAVSFVSWLKVNGQSNTNGNTPSTVTVTVDPTNLLPGPYNTTLQVSAGGNTILVPVAMTVSTIGISPSSITFGNYTTGSTTLPVPQSITLSGAATAFTAAATTNTGGGWLLVSPGSGTSPGTITAALNPAIVPGLATGGYTGKITVTPVGSTSNIAIDIPVTLTVSAAPVVTATPTPLQFNVQIGGTNNITSQVITVAAAPAAQVGFGFTASVDPNPAGKNWISIINPPSGNTNPQTGLAQATVTIDASNLPANTYNGKITLITPGASPNSQDIPVKLVVSAVPMLNIPATPLTFTYQMGGAVPAAQNVNVTATSGSLGYTLATSANTSWLSVPGAGTTAAPFPVTVNPASLPAGTYTGTITVTGVTAGSGTQQIPVTLKVTNDPMIVTNFSSMSFPYQAAQALPASQLLKISSSTGAALNFTATPTQTTCTGNWLVLNNNPGVAVTGSTDASVVVSINPSGLPAGTCTGKITIASTVASTGVASINSPLEIPVTLYISTTPLLVMNPAQPPVFNAALGTQSVPPQTITLSSTSAAAADQLNYTATFTTNNGGSWLFVGPLSGTTANNNVLTISVIPSLLSAGTYTGTITVTATGAGGAAVANSPLTIPVTVNVTAGSLTLGSTALNFTYTAGGSAPAAQTVSIGSSGTPLTYTAVASTGVTPTWLSVSPASGTTSANGTLTVTTDPTKLTAGTYNGTITVTAPGAGNSPATINVTMVVQSGTLSAPTTTLTFNQVLGGSAPAAQTIAVTGTPGVLNYTVTTSSNTPWLTVTPASGSTPGTISVTASAGTLGIGTYNGSVIITSTGATGSPITVPVVLNVVTGQTLSANPSSMSFNYNIGQSAPASQPLAISASGGAGAALSVSIDQSTAPAAFLQITPANSTAPATFTVTATPGSLPAGVYHAQITVSSPSATTPLKIPVTFTVILVPKPVVSAIGNAASYATGNLSPGENIVIFGTGVGPDTLVTGTVTNGVWGTTVGTTRVLFDNIPAPIIYASATQTSVMVPYGVNGRTTTNVVVEFSGVQSNAIAYNVAQAAPGIYTLNQQGTGPGAVLNQNGVTVNSPNTPAPRLSVISVYMTGEGQTNPAGADGVNAVTLKNPINPVTATVNGIAAKVLYAGSAPGLISGVMQVNIEIPDTAPTGGAIPLSISVGGTPTQSGVTIAVSQQ